MTIGDNREKFPKEIVNFLPMFCEVSQTFLTQNRV